jgi:GAF domain-containing protein
MTGPLSQGQSTSPDADAAIAQLARLVLANETLESILGRVAEVARDAVPGAEEVSMTLIQGDRPLTAACTGQLALDADELQYEQGYGPCLEAARAGLVLPVGDMRTEDRWPAYAPYVVRFGVLSSLSLPLPVQGSMIGALNMYATRPHAFDDTSFELAETIADYVAVAVANAHAHNKAAELAEQMRQAMRTRAVIDQAKGIIMAQNHCTADEAFAILSRASQRSNRKLRDIAQSIVQSVVAPASSRVPRPGPASES